MTVRRLVLGLAAACAALAPMAAAAAEAGGLDGRALGIVWVVPFVGILLSIAILPLATPGLWHHHYGKISALWAAAFLVPSVLVSGFGPTFHQLLHTLLLEYLPFIILLFALFTVGGGIYVRGNLHGSPGTNTALLAIGTASASVMGTTGASMVLIRPVIRANDDRRHNVHVMVFFIFLVSNIGGALTPLGDPPLFLGFLLGVSFFWPTTHLLLPMLLLSVLLLGLFYAIDLHLYRKEGHDKPDPTPDNRLRLEGLVNVPLLLGILGAVLVSGTWRPGVAFTLDGIAVHWQNLARDLALLAIAGLSIRLTAPQVRADNGFSWGPIEEVAILFAGIFVTIIPALAILAAGADGALAPVLALVTGADGRPVNAMYFWLTGALSSFLDNAPTYLVFFALAGGNPETLMGPLAATLTAISAGAVFMGANTYIGNAPNLMVKAIAVERGVAMPSFFGYMVWSCGILLPAFLLVTLVFF